MNRFGSAVAGCALLLTASLLLARVHPFGDAGLYPSHTTEPASPPLQLGAATSTLPSEVRDVLIMKCADCHSMQTRSPLYGRLAPASWLMERDVLEGRKHLNLTSWNLYTLDQQEQLKAKILEEVKQGDMPLLQYRLIHWNARVNEDELRALQQWARQPSPQIAASSLAETAQRDPVRGREVYEKRCTGCHAMTRDSEGPRLQGVYGRASGAIAGFSYSPALKSAHLVWNDDSLDKWLADPDTLVPGNNMEFHVANPQERLDLISFLKHSVGK